MQSPNKLDNSVRIPMPLRMIMHKPLKQLSSFANLLGETQEGFKKHTPRPYRIMQSVKLMN